MKINVLVEPSFEDSIWCKEYLKGIKSEISSQNLKLTSSGDADFTIIIGSSKSWLSRQSIERTSIFVTPDVFSHRGVSSCVSINFQQAMQKVLCYLDRGGKSSPLLLGVNPSSAGDSVKEKCFQKNFPLGCIIKNNGDASAMIDNHLEEIKSCDSIICCNSMISALLISKLLKMGIKAGEDVWVLSFGRSSLGEMLSPSITSIDCDYSIVGRSAVKSCMLLAKNQNLSSINMTVDAEIIPSGTTQFFANSLNQTVESGGNLGGGDELQPFYSDEKMKELFSIENLLSHCLEIDFQIIEGLFNNVTYEKLSEKLNMSTNTLKYRIHRMLTLSNSSSRKDLIKLLQLYPIKFDLNK